MVDNFASLLPQVGSLSDRFQVQKSLPILKPGRSVVAPLQLLTQPLLPCNLSLTRKQSSYVFLCLLLACSSNAARLVVFWKSCRQVLQIMVLAAAFDFS